MRYSLLLWALFLANLLTPFSWSGQEQERRTFQPEDMHRIRAVDDLAIAPGGEWVAYTVRETDTKADSRSTDLHMVSWDGQTRLRMTHSKGSESHPRFSPDGKYLAFLAARGGDDSGTSKDPKTKDQVWVLNRSGGEAERLTEIEGGVSSFEWSPDGTRLVLVSKDPEPKDEKGTESEADTPKPIVIERYQFKRDYVGYLGSRYTRLYLFDVASKTTTLLTPGAFDSTDPAWSPDGKIIAFTSKREGDPDRHTNTDIYVVEAREAAEARQLTTWKGSDSGPVFSPDGTKIAYLQGGPPKYTYYDPPQLAVISADGGQPKLLTEELDRSVSAPRWSIDGSTIHFLFDDDRVGFVAGVPASGGAIERLFPAPDDPRGVVGSFEVGARGIAIIASFPRSPSEIYRLPDVKPLSDHNRELREEIEWATVESYDAISKDGVRIGSMLLKPPGWRAGIAYPTIAHVHGGPFGQDGFEFDASSQMLAAQGYLVVNPNYRGSSGRGKQFSRAIYADWGNLEIQDIHAVMDRLVADGLADPDRLGIGGWSYGGMNTNYAIATDTRFSAAVSGASISNMITGYGTDQYIVNYEDELGLPWESIDDYLKTSYPFFHADRIKTPTLFMCGEKDFNVPLINSEQMYQALASLGVPTKLVIYPGQYHGLSKPSYIQDRLERMIEWYGEYLSEESEAP
jgi:dipeptidyl aminopeptidase/acylaminoacyl peptidase